MSSHSTRTIAVGFVLIFNMFYNSGLLRANAPEQSAGTGDCSAASGGAVLLCVLNNHPELQASRKTLDRFAAEKRRAEQRVNPEFNSRVLGGDSAFTAEAALRHTFETGGKRDARIDLAEQNLRVARSRVYLRSNHLVLTAAIQLLQLRQASEDVIFFEETQSTYARAIRRMRARPALSAEQRVNVTTYEIAANETRSRRALLESEVLRLRSELQIAMGSHGPELAAADGLALDFDWPEPDSLSADARESFESLSEEERLARTRVARAQSRVDLEGAEAFPNLSIGPALEYRQSRVPSGGIFGGTSRSSDAEIGLSFRFTLPLFHQNDGGREAAEAELAAERVRSVGVSSRSELERENRLREYRLALRSLRTGISERDLRARIDRLRKTIRGGRVSPPAVIEFYRSVFEYRHRRHDQELLALHALLTMYALDGRLLDKVQNDEIF
ncbi:MAG: TolC family protein [bacterium]|nr:TolC family protein [bacterium]